MRPGIPGGMEAARQAEYGTRPSSSPAASGRRIRRSTSQRWIIDFLPNGTVSPWEDPDDPSDFRQMFEDAAMRQTAQKEPEPQRQNNPARTGACR